MPNTPLRVLMLARAVFPLHGFGGIERHVFHLCTHLLRLGVDVFLVVGATGTATDAEHARTILEAANLATSTALPGLGRLTLRSIRYDRTTPWLRSNGIAGRQINYPLFSLAEGRLAAQMVRGDLVDVVHTQGLCAFGWAWQRRQHAGLRRVPFIANPHGLEEYRTPDWRKRLAYTSFRALYSWAHRAAPRVIATDDCTQDDLPRYLGVKQRQVAVIPSAIDVAECLALVSADRRAALRQRFGLADTDPILLSVSRVERNKGYHVMLDALARIAPTLGPHWRWLLVGTGKALTALQAQAAALGLASHITWAGNLDDADLHSLYEEADLFVHPTLYEGSSLVTLEAMLHRLPVIASAAGGIPDKVFTNTNGILVPPGDATALATALRDALAQRSAWPAWGERSVAIVRTTFDWPIVARRTLAAYEELLGS